MTAVDPMAEMVGRFQRTSALAVDLSASAIRERAEHAQRHLEAERLRAKADRKGARARG